MARRSGESYLYADLLGATIQKVIIHTKNTESSKNSKVIETTVDQFQDCFQSVCEPWKALDNGDVRSFLSVQHQIISMFSVERPHVHAWILECWDQIHPAIDNLKINKRCRDDVEDLYIALQRVHELFLSSHSFSDPDLDEHLSRYFDILRRIVGRWPH